MPPPPVPNKEKDVNETKGSKVDNKEMRVNDPLEAEFEMMWDLTTDLDDEDLRQMTRFVFPCSHLTYPEDELINRSDAQLARSFSTAAS